MKAFGLGITFMMLLTLSACSGGDDPDGGGVDLTPPTVESYYPDPAVDGSVSSSDIQTNGIQVLFSEAMDVSSINGLSFTVEAGEIFGGGLVPGTITFDPSIRTATFTPVSALAVSWDYVVTVSSMVRDTAGNQLAADYSWTFTVGDAPPPGSV